MEDTQATEGQETTTEQAAPETASVPPEVSERLNELSGRFDQFEPVLGQMGQYLQSQQEQPQEEQPGFDEFVDPETGYVLNPEGLQQYIAQESARIAQEQYGPLQQQVQHIERALQDESIDALQDEFPQLADQAFVSQQFGPELVAAANEIGSQLGLNEQQTEALRLSPSFIRQQYLARSAGQQAQQQAVAGGQETVIEGGSGNPGQPEVNETQERFRNWAQQGAQGGVWGQRLDQL